MSSEEFDPVPPAPPPRRNWPAVLIVFVLIALLGVNGWLAYQTWMLNQTLSQFAAQRNAAPFANGAFAPQGLSNAGAEGQAVPGLGRQRGQTAPDAATGASTESVDALNPAVESDLVEAPAGDNMPGATGAAAVNGERDRSAGANGAAPAARGAFDRQAAGRGNVDTDPSAILPTAGDNPAPGAAPGDATDRLAGGTTTTEVTDAEAASAGRAESTAMTLASIPVVTGVKGVRVWDDNGNLLMAYESGATLSATGRSQNGDWLIVESDAGPGWVQRDQVIAYGVQQLAESTLPASTVLAPLPGSGDTEAAASVPAISLVAPITETITAEPGAGGVLATPTPVGPAATEISPAGTTIVATVAISDARLNVRSGPGVEYPIIGKASPGAEYAVTGRNSPGTWLQLRLDDLNGNSGWVDATFLAVIGDISTLPEPAVPPAPAGDSAAINGPAASTAGLISIQAERTLPTGAELQGTIVFAQSRGGMIYAYHLATGVLQPLTQGFDPAISPDGQTVAFTRDGGETGIYLIGIDGSNERRIFERPSLSSPKWSPDGEWILFSRNDDFIECYEVGMNQCLIPEVFFKRFPFAKPGQFPLAKEFQYKLSAVDFDGQNFHDIPALDSARAPDWSEAGIVYQSKAGIQRTADESGIATETVAFDNLNPYYFDPDWQPNGSQIAFQLKGAAQTDIWVVNSDGGGMHGLTAPATALVDQMPSNVAPAYSPDGAHIIFLSNRDEHNGAGAWRIWVMNADGGNQEPLPLDIPIDYSFGLEQMVSWGS